MSRVEIADHRWRTTLSVTTRGESARQHCGSVRRILTCEADRLERVASRFRADSEISAVNAAAGSRVPISPLLEALLRVALSAARTTDGAVTPCLGRQVDAMGYRSWRAGDVNAVALSDPAPFDPESWMHVELGAGHVRVPRDVHLDLGATAKAWLADEVAEQVADRTGLDVIANMGGDLRAITARRPWVVSIDHGVPQTGWDAIEIQNAGLATSGQSIRRWRTPGGPSHHLIDPRTGRSSRTRWWAASVIASTATAANTSSTAAMVLDAVAPQWLADRSLDAALTAWDGTDAAPSQTAVGRWPQKEEAA